MTIRQTVLLITFFAAGLLLVYLGYQVYQLRNVGRIIGDVIDATGAVDDAFPCLAEPIDEGIFIQQLEQSKLNLQRINYFGFKPSNIYLQLGRVNCLLGEPEAAVNAYQKYTQMRPKNPLGHLELGFALEELCSRESSPSSGESPSADIYICADEELHNAILSAWKLGASPEDFYDVGEGYFDENQLYESLIWYRRALAMDPVWSDPYFGLGFTNEKLLQWDEAARYYQQALEINQFRRVRLSDAYLRLGIIYQSNPQNPDFAKALEMYAAAVEQDEFSSVKLKGNTFYKRGEIYILQGRELTDVIGEFKTALSIYPNHHWARLKLGSAIYNSSGNIELAEVELKKAIEIWPNDHQRHWPYQVLGDIYARENMTLEAINMYEQALIYDPESTYLSQQLASLMDRDN